MAGQSLNEKIFLILNGNHFTFLDYLTVFASNLFLCIPILLLFALIAVKYFQKKDSYYPWANTFLLIFVFLMEFVFCYFLLPDLFSSIFQMGRPCLNPNISSMVRLVGEDCSNNSNFFAIRPFLMFFITSFLFFTVKKDFPAVKWFLIIWSLLVSYSRIYLGVHYPVNVLIADTIGIFVGYFGSRIYFYLKDHFFVIL